MKLVLSFDDGRGDSYNGFQTLRRHNLVASFHVVTQFIEKTKKYEGFGDPLSVEQLIEMKNFGCEISSHGDNHIMEINDFKTSFAKLNKWGLCGISCGFSVPNSDYDEGNLILFENEEKCSYIRLGRSPKCYSFRSKLYYLLYHITKFQLFYNLFNRHNVLNCAMGSRLYSVVVKRDVRVRNIIRFLKKYEQTSFIIILMFHSVSNHCKDCWSYSTKKFETLCDYLEKSSIEVTTLRDLMNDKNKI